MNRGPQSEQSVPVRHCAGTPYRSSSEPGPPSWQAPLLCHAALHESKHHIGGGGEGGGGVGGEGNDDTGCAATKRCKSAMAGCLNLPLRRLGRSQGGRPRTAAAWTATAMKCGFSPSVVTLYRRFNTCSLHHSLLHPPIPLPSASPPRSTNAPTPNLYPLITGLARALYLLTRDLPTQLAPRPRAYCRSVLARTPLGSARSAPQRARPPHSPPHTPSWTAARASAVSFGEAFRRKGRKLEQVRTGEKNDATKKGLGPS